MKPIKPSDTYTLTVQERRIVNPLISYLNGELKKERSALYKISYKQLEDYSEGLTSRLVAYVLQLFQESGWTVQYDRTDRSSSDPLVWFSRMPQLRY